VVGNGGKAVMCMGREAIEGKQWKESKEEKGWKEEEKAKKVDE